MGRDEFVKRVWALVAECPKEWRKGQAVFNVIDDYYGVARAVQFIDKVDCFYDDSAIEEFIELAWKRWDFIESASTIIA